MFLGAWANLNEKNGLEDFQGGKRTTITEQGNLKDSTFVFLNGKKQSWNHFPRNLIMLQTLLLSTWFFYGVTALYF